MNDLEKEYLLFLYLLYKGPREELERVCTGGTTIDEAVQCYQTDPIFNKLCNINRNFIRRIYG